MSCFSLLFGKNDAFLYVNNLVANVACLSICSCSHNFSRLANFEIQHMVPKSLTTMLDPFFGGSKKGRPGKKKKSDLHISPSHHNSFSVDFPEYYHSCATISLCPDVLLTFLIAALAVAFVILYIQITMKGRRRRKRDESQIGLAAIQQAHLPLLFYWGRFI